MLIFSQGPRRVDAWQTLLRPVLHARFRRTRRGYEGQAALSMVFIIGGIIVFASLSLAFIIVSFISSSSGYQASNRALAAASAGANDAILRIARDATYASSSFSVPIDSYTATVSMTTSTTSTVIMSTAQVLGYERSVRVVVSIVSSTGAFSILAWDFL